ncbi:MAG: hypothetical protein KDA60_19585 [Planctomycetales bacterium]|nr:hypothetical protein [Planctomycetales bacterium]
MEFYREEDEPSAGPLESLIRRIPGFSGYNDESDRQASDALSRREMAGQLERAKRAIERLSREFLDGGRIDEITMCDRMRGRLDLMLAKLRSAPVASGDVWGGSSARATLFEDVLDNDLLLLEQATSLANDTEHATTDSWTSLRGTWETRLTELGQKLDYRMTLIRGEEPA